MGAAAMKLTTINDSAGQLRALVERIEALEAEKAEAAARVREVYAEAKANGFDGTALRALVRERRLSPDERAERDAMLQLYRDALAGLAATPLGESGLREAARAAVEHVVRKRVVGAFKDVAGARVELGARA
jgi:uncharacterized protein (UPF0335 family)